MSAKKWSDLDADRKIELPLVAVAAFATLVYAVIAGFQLCALNATLRETQDTNARTVRAWLMPEMEEKLFTPVSSESELTWFIPFVGVSARNYGTLPAMNMRSTTDWGWTRADLPSPAEGPKGGALIPPGNQKQPWLEMRRRLLLKKEDMDAINAGTKTLYVGGVITYDDPAGQGRYTRWCATFAPATKDFTFCEQGVDIR